MGHIQGACPGLSVDYLIQPRSGRWARIYKDTGHNLLVIFRWNSARRQPNFGMIREDHRTALEQEGG